MRTILIALLFSPFLFQAQEIVEICPSALTNGTVVDFENIYGTTYATGFFNTICGQSGNYVAKWEDGSWVPANFELTDPGHSLRTIDDKLYIARYEESIDSNWVYVYDGFTLEKFGEGVYLTTASGFSELPNIYDVLKYNGEIYACGEFDRVGTQEISGIIRWNGSSWEDVAGGLTGNIQGSAPVIFPHAMLVFNDELYVGGNFRYAGGIEVNGIAKWNGSSWTSLAEGFNGTVYGLGEYQGELYAGGSFTMSGSTELNRIAKWDGTNWVSPGFGFVPNSSSDFIFVHTFEEIESELYIGGGLKKILYDNGTEEICNGVVAFSGAGLLNTFENGVPNNDIEAIIKTNEDLKIFGGGVFGSGFVGMIPETGIEDFNEPTVSIYPNPVQDILTISSPIQFESIAIFNSRGKQVLSSSGKNQIDLSHLSSGFYIVETLHIYGIERHSFIKK